MTTPRPTAPRLCCAGCGWPITLRPGARFCAGCGQPMAAACPGCGHDAELGDRHCTFCARSLVSGDVIALPRATPAEDDLDDTQAELLLLAMDAYQRANNWGATPRQPSKSHIAQAEIDALFATGTVGGPRP